MAGTAVLGRLTWRQATVVSTIPETRRVRSLVLNVPGWRDHLPGQHVDVRLTAGDGYQAQRSYSLASLPGSSRKHADRASRPDSLFERGVFRNSAPDGITLTVELVDDGEVSSYLVEEARAGDQLEVRGPIGGYFVWDIDRGGPVLLVAGGSGVVPLAAMVRHRTDSGSDVPMRLLYSSRSYDDVIYRDELDRLAEERRGFELTHTLTRAQPPGWNGYSRRVDAAMLAAVGWPPETKPLAYVCGPTQFVEAVAEALQAQGHAPDRIRTERFGPTGGRDGQ